MRLFEINVDGALTFTPRVFEPPPYAILSHTWSSVPDTEVLYQDILDRTAEAKRESYAKIHFMKEQTQKKGLKHFWIDNCCIDKRNDAELSESIRSMYRWYKNADWCFVYLSDVSAPTSEVMMERGTLKEEFLCCRWLKRGWTLQELLAPSRVEFFARDYYLGNRTTLAQQIHDATGIHLDVLRGMAPEDFSVETRLRWAAGRQTTIPEDSVYSIMGLCSIIMVPLYGEGKSAAQARFNEEIDKVKQRESVRLAERKSKLDALRFDIMEARRADIKDPFGQTCKWILGHPAYQKWVDPTAAERNQGFFWIKGKPGAGKSVLIKYLDMHISCGRDEQRICISYYFNARGETLEKSLEGLYRSLLSQLLEADENLQTVLDDTSALRRGASRTWLQDLRKAFAAAVMKLRQQRLFCFVDALDECSESEMQPMSEMIEYFRQLCDEAARSDICLKICFASRHYPALDIPTCLQLILEDNEDHQEDLEDYVRNVTFSHSVTGESRMIPNEIRAEVLAKSNGVFLWVVLVMEILKSEFIKGRLHAVKRRLREIPRSLNTLFKEIVQRDQENIEEFLLCLRWILYSLRPLRLEEFYFAMMAGLNDDQLHRNADVSHEDMLNFLKSSSKGLVEMTKDVYDPRAQFIHESVRDFLTKGRGFYHIDPDFDPSPCKAHEVLKNCCQRTLLLTTKHGFETTNTGRSHGDIVSLYAARSPEDPHDPVDLYAWARCNPYRLRATNPLPDYPFLEYSVRNIFNHANLAAPEVPQWDFLQRLDLNSVSAINSAFEDTEPGIDYILAPPLIYFLAVADAANLIEILASNHVDMYEVVVSGIGTPLMHALNSKSFGAARLLLRLQDAENPDEIVAEIVRDAHVALAIDLEELVLSEGRAAQGLKTWTWAARCGFLGLLEHDLMLHRRLNVPVEAVELAITVKAAIRAQVGEVVRYILRHVAQTDVLVIASGPQADLTSGGIPVEFVALLLGSGVDGTAHASGSTAIDSISRNNNRIDLIKSLLEHIVHADSKEVVSSIMACVRSLLEHDVGMDARDGIHHCAISQPFDDYTGTIELLLDNIVQLVFEPGALGNQLERACGSGHSTEALHGHVDPTDLLLVHSITADAHGRRYRCTLHNPSWHRRLQRVDQWLIRGIRSASAGVNGMALPAASPNIPATAAELPLGRGVDVNVLAGLRGTICIAATARGLVGVIQLHIGPSTSSHWSWIKMTT